MTPEQRQMALYGRRTSSGETAEGGLAGAVNMLRDAWNRTAETPRKIEVEAKYEHSVKITPTEQFSAEIATRLTAQSWRQLQVAMG